MTATFTIERLIGDRWIPVKRDEHYSSRDRARSAMVRLNMANPDHEHRIVEWPGGDTIKTTTMRT